MDKKELLELAYWKALGDFLQDKQFYLLSLPILIIDHILTEVLAKELA